MSRQGRGNVLTGGHFRPELPRAFHPDTRRADAAERITPADALGAALQELDRLREENEILRQSAHSFGALAERLYKALQGERAALRADAPETGD